MKYISLCLLAGFLPAVFVRAQQTLPADEEEFLRLEKVWNEAHLGGDVAVLESLWADNITIIVPGMSPLTRSDALEMWRNIPVQFTRYESTIAKLRVFDEIAVVSGSLTRKRNFGGRIAEEHWYFTKVYRRVAETWQVIVFHASGIPE